MVYKNLQSNKSLAKYKKTVTPHGDLVVTMVTQERKGSPEAVLIYFVSTTYHL